MTRPAESPRPTPDGPESRDHDLPEPAPWPKNGSRVGADYRIFRSRFDDLVNPRTGQSMERVVLETPDWVNVIAVTKGGRIVVVRQHRFGTAESTIEIPGGMVDPGEEPRVAAERELREETGYVAANWTYLGSVEPNPAFLSNRCHHFLARGCALTEDQEQDAGEDIFVGTLSPSDLAAAIESGAITHSLVITAVARVMDLRTHSIFDPEVLEGRGESSHG